MGGQFWLKINHRHERSLNFENSWCCFPLQESCAIFCIVFCFPLQLFLQLFSFCWHCLKERITLHKMCLLLIDLLKERGPGSLLRVTSTSVLTLPEFLSEFAGLLIDPVVTHPKAEAKKKPGSQIYRKKKQRILVHCWTLHVAGIWPIIYRCVTVLNRGNRSTTIAAHTITVTGRVIPRLQS